MFVSLTTIIIHEKEKEKEQEKGKNINKFHFEAVAQALRLTYRPIPRYIVVIVIRQTLRNV